VNIEMPCYVKGVLTDDYIPAYPAIVYKIVASVWLYLQRAFKMARALGALIKGLDKLSVVIS